MKPHRRVFHIIPLCIFLVVSSLHPVFAQQMHSIQFKGPLLLLINDSSSNQAMQLLANKIAPPLLQRYGIEVRVWNFTRYGHRGQEAFSLQGYYPLIIVGHGEGGYQGYQLAQLVNTFLLVTLDPHSYEEAYDPGLPKPSHYWIHAYLKGDASNMFWGYDWVGDRVNANKNLHLGMKFREVEKMWKYVEGNVLQALVYQTCCQ